jgi:hypothetical protein
MREICAVAIVIASSFMCAVAQDKTPKPKVSDEPLTAEQMAVYRAVLQEYPKGSDGALNLANRTEPLERSDLEEECIKGIELEPKNSVGVVHKLDASVAFGPKIVQVDPDRQEQQVEENDPQKLLKSAIDDHEQVTNKQLDDSAKKAFETGLFSLSEIQFDKQHTRAVVAYSFVCGGLCGNGNTLVLKKVGQKWRVSKRCGGWVS